MAETILKFGGTGAILIVSLFLVILIISQPGSEVSFFGICFKRRHFRLDFVKYFRRIPRELPPSWWAIIDIFASADASTILLPTIFLRIRSLGEMTEMEAREALHHMEKIGLVKNLGGQIRAEKPVLRLIIERQKEFKTGNLPKSK